ncbi:VCBS repeat domain-containing M23 family metallopeptidase [Tenggerimyces flavus]|uniref:FG-GAP-like repeat-containing protein n=1 Tax=Tenggerimyces flavus TaxID=1708749 RepID=A0ABV7YGP4_9ACTN|nr:VCBS repeat domain-containing M23 family metallopeptidase [Tenggerimyces flavus]MBM7787897.1 hypothetical protein [Tenggerimyces flavus]
MRKTFAALAIAALCVVTATVVPSATAAVAARPNFELPFPCGEKWNGATYNNHGGSGNDFPLDLNWGSGDDDLGKPVVASAAGTVSYGVAGVIEINHGDGWSTSYRHLSNRVAANGSTVARGQLIGKVGEEGNASGPHLHYAQQLNGTAVHIVLHGVAITYSYVYNGPLYTSYNCGVSARPAESVNGDAFDDLLAVTASDELRMYPGRATGVFGQSVRVGPGWTDAVFNRLGTSDVDGDGLGDIVGTTAAGKLNYWRNNGNGTSFSKSTNEGSGWSGYQWLTFVDLNGDNKADIVARDGDVLYWWRGLGTGVYGARTEIGEGWATFPEFGGGDADGDGDGDLWATDAAGKLFFWRGNGAGGFATKIEAGSGWNVFGPFNVMDLNGDGKADLVAANAAGDLFRWLGKGDGKFNSAGPRIGFGWTDVRIASY